VPVESEKQALGSCVTFFDAHTGRNLDSNHGSWGIERIVALALPPAKAMQTTHGNWVDIRHTAPYHTRRRVLQTYLADQFKHRYTPLYINLNVMLACSNHAGTYLHAQYSTFHWFLSFIQTRPSSCLSNKVAFKKWNVLQHTSSPRQVLESGQQPAAVTAVVAGATDADADAGDADVDVDVE
jgi:hypothetical protein